MVVMPRRGMTSLPSTTEQTNDSVYLASDKLNTPRKHLVVIIHIT